MNVFSQANLIILVSIITLFASCKEEKPHFTIEGTITGADSTVLYLERRSLTETTIIDSVKLDKEGSFILKPSAIEYLEFYRLKLEDQAINLVIDSTETIKVNADKETFATLYTIDGSDASAKLKETTLAYYKLQHNIVATSKEAFEKKVTRDQYLQQVSEHINTYKTEAKTAIIADFASPVAYYILFLRIDGQSIFNAGNKDDLALYRAIATAWESKHPESPRTKQLRDFTLNALASKREAEKNEATLIELLAQSDHKFDNAYYDITLPDNKGVEISLSSLRGKYVILDFTSYEANYSPNHNIMLNEMYKKYNAKAEIYQVSFDTDINRWKNTAINLPWICVKEMDLTHTQLVKKYNLSTLPSTFILDKEGTPIKRLESMTDINKEMEKLP